MFRHGRHAKRRRLRISLRILFLVFCVFCLIYPFLEPYRLTISRLEVESEDLSRDVGQLRIVYVTDIHESAFPYYTKSQTDRLIARINTLHADLVILGGDYTDSLDGATEFFTRIRYGKHIQSVYGVFGVLGEHDRDMDDASTTQLRAAMIAAGITPLINDSVQLRIGSSIISVAGLDDVERGWPNLAQTAAKVHGSDFCIFACHNPSILEDLGASTDADSRRGWVDLGLFGHTHGGQLPLLGDLLHLTNGISPEHIRGVRIENRKPMIISCGIGTSVVPMRLFRTPEIHLITVKAAR
ncbi:MAG: metallophosphoesterase [Clostridia bacterium]|nr:metallophosphoesterase [Clostridia bacterium]